MLNESWDGGKKRLREFPTNNRLHRHAFRFRFRNLERGFEFDSDQISRTKRKRANTWYPPRLSTGSPGQLDVKFAQENACSSAYRKYTHLLCVRKSAWANEWMSEWFSASSTYRTLVSHTRTIAVNWSTARSRITAPIDVRALADLKSLIRSVSMADATDACTRSDGLPGGASCMHLTANFHKRRRNLLEHSVNIFHFLRRFDFYVDQKQWILWFDNLLFTGTHWRT